MEMEAEQDRRTQELGRVGRGCHGRCHSTTDSSPPTYGHPDALQEPAPKHRGSKLAKALSPLRLMQAQEQRSLLLALGEREQYHSERPTRIEKHQETQLGTMSSQLTSLSRQLQRTSSEQRQPPLTHPQPWRGRSGRPPPQETDSSSSGARGPQQTTREVKAQFHPGEDRIRILDSPEERRTARQTPGGSRRYPSRNSDSWTSRGFGGLHRQTPAICPTAAQKGTTQL